MGERGCRGGGCDSSLRGEKTGWEGTLLGAEDGMLVEDLLFPLICDKAMAEEAEGMDIEEEDEDKFRESKGFNEG